MKNVLKVLLVTGGSNSLVEDSTETLVEGELSWKMVGNLPLILGGIRATNLNNAVYAFGNCNMLLIINSFLPKVDIMIITMELKILS